MPTQFVLGRIGNSSSFQASIAMFHPSLLTTSRNKTFRSQSAQLRIRALTVAHLWCSSPTKFYGSVTNCIARSLTHTRYVPTDSVCVTTRGTRIAHWALTWTPFSYLLSHRVRIFNLNLACLRTGRYPISRSSKLLLLHGIPRTYTCLGRVRL